MGTEEWDRLLETARKQSGLITREQALRLGCSKSSWDYRVKVGLLRCLHTGLYEVCPPGPNDPRELQAALLCAGEDAVLSHRTAAKLHRLWGIDGFPLEVSVPSRRRLLVPGVSIRRNKVGAEDRCRFKGLPMTTPVRTILDLVPLLDAVSLAVLLESTRQPGRGLMALLKARMETFELSTEQKDQLRALIEDCEQRPRPYGSVYEVQFANRLVFSGLPPPKPQFPVQRAGGKVFYLDFAWPEAMLAVETMGYERRNTGAALDYDSGRFTELQSLGWLPVPVTYTMFRDTYRKMMSEVRSMYEARLAERKGQQRSA